MLRVFAGFLLVSVILSVIALALRSTWYQPESDALFWLIEIAFQPAAAILTFSAVHWIRPRRLLVGPKRASLFLVALGATAGIVAVVLAALAFAFLDERRLDGPVMVISGAIAGLAAALVLRRHRPGWCAVCRYDLRGRDPESACPECGHAQCAPR